MALLMLVFGFLSILLMRIDIFPEINCRSREQRSRAWAFDVERIQLDSLKHASLCRIEQLKRGVGLWKRRLRAAYWRKLGFPNLVRDLKARWKGHVRKGKHTAGVELDTPLSSVNGRAGSSVQPRRDVGATGSIWRRGCLVFRPRLEDSESMLASSR